MAIKQRLLFALAYLAAYPVGFLLVNTVDPSSQSMVQGAVGFYGMAAGYVYMESIGRKPAWGLTALIPLAALVLLFLPAREKIV